MDLKGFKSFADHTEILFQPGINIIVGPNGCGKSNVVDAIRWVLGESNIRNIRGQRNEDIIFSGTDRNRALGMASVEITLDNSDQLIPTEFSEITVARKLFRTGESEYSVNRSRVRMKDIQTLFTGTGVGKRGYSIVGQGELEQVLNGQGLDRRLYLEEASGISKHRQQREEVQRRIAHTDEDLIRVKDILSELSNRKEEVYVKSEKAKAYKLLAEEHMNLEKNLLLHDWKRVETGLTQRQTEAQEMARRLEELDQHRSDLDQELNQQAQVHEEKRLVLERLKEERFGLESDLQSLFSDSRLSQERIRNALERVNSSDEDHNKYLQMAEAIRIDLDNIKAEYLRELDKHQEKQQLFSELNTQEDQLLSSIQEYEASLNRLKNELFQAMNEETSTRNRIRSGEEKQTRLRERWHRLEIQNEEMKLQTLKCREEKERLLRQQREADTRSKKDEAGLEQLVQQKKQLEASRQDLQSGINDLNRHKIKLENELLAVRERQKSLAGYSPGVKFLMRTDNRSRFPGIIGVVGEMIEVPAGLEIAIETAAGKGLENIVVDRVDRARQAIDFLKGQRAGRVTFLPLDVLRTAAIEAQWVKSIASHRGALGLASRLVKYDLQYQSAVDYLLGRILIVEDMDSGIEFVRKFHYPLRIVTLEGEVFAVGGALTGGSRGQQQEGPLQRRQNERRLESELDEVMQKMNKLQADDAVILENLQQLQHDMESVRSSLTENRVLVQMVQQQIKDNEQQELRLQQELASGEDELAYLQQEIKGLEKDILSLESLREEQESTSQTLSHSLESTKTNMDDTRRELEIHRARVASYREQVETKAGELNNLKRSQDQMQQVYDSYRQSAEEAQALHFRLQQEISDERQRLVTIDQRMSSMQTELQALNTSLEEELLSEKTCRSRLEQIKAGIEPLKVQSEQYAHQIHQNELLLARLETEQAGLLSRWEEKFAGQPMEGQESAVVVGGVRVWRQRLEELEAAMLDLEPVDLTAVEEYQQVSERHDFLSRQVQDLLEAKESLTNLLKETESLIMRKFTQFLVRANESFSQTFAEIFNGGEASLVLESGEDRLEAGIEFEIKLPGKRVQALNLLSGGERALTCIAFIFSLLRLKPTPFCLLDEIDAALDETNLMRYTQFLKGMAEQMQFVVVTHRQATIECGNHLYGVTMPDKGVSKVFTLNLSQAETLAG